MPETREILRGGVEGFEPAPNALERTLRKARGRRRRRRAGAAVLAMMVTAGLISGLWTAFRPEPERHRPAQRQLEPGEIRVGGQVIDIAVGDRAVWAVTCVARCANDMRDALGRVVRIDPGTNRVVASIPVGPPQAIATGEGGAWAVDFWNGKVARIDPRSNRVVATIPLRLPFAVGHGPGSHDFLPFDVTVGEGAVWVSTDRGAVARIDPRSNSVAALVRVEGEATSELAAGAGAVWVPQGVLGVWRIDPSTNQVVAKIPAPRTAKRVLETGSPAVADGSVWVGEGVVRITGDPAGPYVIGHGGGLSRIDPRSNRIVDTIRFSHSVGVVASGGGSVWAVENGRGVWRIDPATNRPVGSPLRIDGVLRSVGYGSLWVAESDGIVRRVPIP
jgi:streptogramin lyase